MIHTVLHITYSTVILTVKICKIFFCMHIFLSYFLRRAGRLQWSAVSPWSFPTKMILGEQPVGNENEQFTSSPESTLLIVIWKQHASTTGVFGVAFHWFSFLSKGDAQELADPEAFCFCSGSHLRPFESLHSIFEFSGLRAWGFGKFEARLWDFRVSGLECHCNGSMNFDYENLDWQMCKYYRAQKMAMHGDSFFCCHFVNGVACMCLEAKLWHGGLRFEAFGFLG